ncbi:MAG: thioredoxin domain-containing protein [Myxococcales bacterium]|nr:thioredoxin domain-containing protein [Myxococcales bacterium]
MKKNQLVILVAAGLFIVFAVGGYIYKQQRAEKTQEMAKQAESPLSRAYAQTLGPADAKVVIVEFFDPGCETCRMFAEPVKKLMDSYPGKVRLVKRYAPFHHGADKVVQILEAARLQGKYWETLGLLFEGQHRWADHHSPNPDMVWQLVGSLGLDMERLRKDANDPRILAIVAQDIADAEALGVHKTPGFFVNGKTMSSFGLEQLQTLVAEEVRSQYGG